MIGFAFPSWGERNVIIARHEFDRLRAAGGPEFTISYDSDSNRDTPEIEVLRAMRMLRIEGLVGIVGHGGSRGSLVAAPLYNEAEVVHIVPTGTHGALREAGPWTFALAPDDYEIATRMADFVTEKLRAQSVTICYIGDEYGFGMLDGLQRACRNRSLKIVDMLPFSTRSDFPALVELSLRVGVPDVVMIIGQDKQTGALVGAFSSQVPGLRFMGSDGIEITNVYADQAGAGVDSLYTVAFWHQSRPDSASLAFAETYRKLVGESPNGPQAMRRDALMLLAAAVQDVGPDQGKIRDWLLELGAERPPFAGVTGDIRFDTERRNPLVVIRSWQGGTVMVDSAPEAAP